jgi:hypothetical protein
MKTCTTCKETKPLDSFYRKASSSDGHERYCKKCHKVRTKAHYTNNSEVYKKRALTNRNSNCALLREYKSNLSCTVCKENRPWCLDFHHPDPSKKEFGIGSMRSSWNRMKDEIDKCVVLCRNCHADEHHRLKNIPQVLR